MIIQTKRLNIHLASDEEMLSLIQKEKTDELKQAYQEMYDNTKKYPEEKEYYGMWFIEKEGEHIGEMCFKGIRNDGLEIGYGICEEYQNKGYGTESVKALVEWALSHEQIQKVYAYVEKENLYSIKLLEKIGFLRGNDCEDGNLYYERRKIRLDLNDSRVNIINNFYSQINEDSRLIKSRAGQLEFLTTMHYIHRYLKKNDKIIEIGAGTGRYSIALAKEGYDVTSIELVEDNLKVLKENSKELKNIKAYQGDAINLKKFDDNSFDVTLVFGPMYHLYNSKEVHQAIDEAIRITKKDGVILFAFLSIYAIYYSNYFYGNWMEGLKENYTDDYQLIHKKEQLFTGYDIKEFEDLFKNKETKWITTAAMDGSIEALEARQDFYFSDEEFESFVKWHIHFSETRELLGNSSHLLYICRK